MTLVEILSLLISLLEKEVKTSYICKYTDFKQTFKQGMKFKVNKGMG